MRAESVEGIAYENKSTGTGIPFGNGVKAYSYQAAVGSVTGGQRLLPPRFTNKHYSIDFVESMISRKGISKTKQIKT